MVPSILYCLEPYYPWLDFFLDIFAGFMLECKELDESLLVLLCHFCVFKDHRSLLMNNGTPLILLEIDH